MVVSVLFFAAFDGKSDNELWYYYDGKFYEPTSGDTGALGGLYPRYLDAFGDDLLFEATDAADVYGLWITNGTRAGTHEITGIKDVYLGSQGLDPSLMTTYKNMVLFDGQTGYAGAAVDALWVTKGAGGSTYQLGGHANRNIKGANTTDGLMAYAHGFTIFDGVAYFDGYDAAGNIGL